MTPSPVRAMAAAAVPLVAALVLPPLSGLSVPGQRALGVTAAAVVLWSTEALPFALTALMVVTLLAVTGAARSAADALAGMASPILFFLLGTAALGQAVVHTGLATRLAAWVAGRSGGSPRHLVRHLLLAMPPLALALPSAITRNAMLVPIYRDALQRLALGGRTAAAVMLGLGILNPLASSALLTGGTSPITTATLLGGISWTRWFALMWLPYYTLMAAGGLWLLLRADKGTVPAPAASPSSPLGRGEIVAAAVIAATTLLWAADAIHGWHPAVPALLAMAALTLPPLGVLPWTVFERALPWGTLLTVGAALSLAQAMVTSGAAAWLAEGLVDVARAAGIGGVSAAVFLIVVVAVVHLAVPNIAACIALLIPVVTSFAPRVGLNPFAAGLLVGIVVDAVVLYPAQTASNLIAYEAGTFGGRDVRWLGVWMWVASAALLLGVVAPYWARLGVPLVVR